MSGGDWKKGNTVQRAFARIFALKENGEMFFFFSCQHNGELSNVCDDVYGIHVLVVCWFVNLILARLVWEEGTSAEKIPP